MINPWNDLIIHTQKYCWRLVYTPLRLICPLGVVRGHLMLIWTFNVWKSSRYVSTPCFVWGHYLHVLTPCFVWGHCLHVSTPDHPYLKFGLWSHVSTLKPMFRYLHFTYSIFDFYIHVLTPLFPFSNLYSLSSYIDSSKPCVDTSCLKYSTL